MLNSGTTKFLTMTQDNHSSRQEDESKQIEELKKKAENLQRILDLTRKTLDHDKEMQLKQPTKFGKYEMT